MTFSINDNDLKKLQRFFKAAPKLIQPVTADVLNSLAFKTRENDIKNISSTMVIRSRSFLRSNLWVEKAKPSQSIESQIAIAASIKRSRFSGWEEQQEGKWAPNKRSPTLGARDNNFYSVVRGRNRMKPGNKFYKPSQFKARSSKSSFMFMMRFLSSKNGGEFILDEAIKTNKGSLGKGVYSFRNHKITRIQKTDQGIRTKSNPWRTRSISDLKQNNDMMKIWSESITKIVNQFNK